MRRLLVILAVFACLLPVQPISAASICTAFLSPGQDLPPWEQPGTVLCLHAGDYPHPSAFQINANSATYQTAPGESQAHLVGTGLVLLGHDLVLSNLHIDNGGTDGPSIPGVNVRGDRVTLDRNLIRNGHYNGVEVRGQGDTLIGNQINNFDGVTGDAECVTVFKTADHVRILSNNIHDCSGNGIELYTLDGLADSQVSDDVLIDGNTVARGDLARGETGIGLKHGNYVTITNNIVSGQADYNWSIGARGWVSHLLIAGNTVRQSYTGLAIGLFDNGGIPTDVTVRGNTIDLSGGRQLGQTGGGFGMEFSGCVSCTISGNVIAHAAVNSLFFESQGMRGGSITGNTISNSPGPRLWPGAQFSGVTFGFNQWSNAAAGFLASASDTTGAGIPVTSVPSPTRTASPSPSPTVTPTSTASPTPTSTSTPTATASETATATSTATETSTPLPSPTAAVDIRRDPVSGCWVLYVNNAPISLSCPQ